MKSNIFITLKKELRAILREKKSLIIMLLTPLIIPIYFFAFSFIFDGMMNEEYFDDSNTSKYQVGINYELSDPEKEIIKNLNLELITYKNKEELEKAYNNKDILFYIIYDNNKYTIYGNDMSNDGSIASTYITSYLDSYNNYKAQEYLTSIGADINKVYHSIDYEFESVEGSNIMMDTLISIGFTFAIMSICLTAIYTTTDTMAGEKERGTLETFLTFPVKSYEIIAGKYLAITTSCIITSLLDIILVVLSLSGCYYLFDVYNNAILNINFGTIILAIIILISFAIFISGLSILISSKAKTYKEAQSSLTPLSLVTIIPMFLTTAGIELNLGMSFIPIVSHTYLLQDLLIGNSNILYLIITFITTIIYTILIINIISKIYSKEDILFQN